METTIDRIFGRIFFPDLPDVPLDNVWLNITDEHIFIEVPTDKLRHSSWPVLWGEFIGLDEVTFFWGDVSGGNTGSGSSFRRLYVTSMIKRIRIEHPDYPSFKKVTFNSAALRKWILEPHFIDHHNSEGIKIPAPMKICEVSMPGVNIRVSLGYGMSLAARDAAINQHCSISFEFVKYASHTEVRDKLAYFLYLILFITNDDPSLDSIVLETSDAGGLEFYSPPHKYDVKRFSDNFEVDYSLSKRLLPKIIKDWFASRKKLEPTVELLLEKYKFTQLSTPRFFQNVCISIESYHSNFINKKPDLYDTEKNAKREAISLLLEKEVDLNSFFREESTFWKDPQLIDRLNYFRTDIEFIMGNSFLITVDDLMVEIKKTRNDITHRGSYSRVLYIELILFTKLIELTLKIAMLRKWGIDVSKGHYSMLERARSILGNLATLNAYPKERLGAMGSIVK